MWLESVVVMECCDQNTLHNSMTETICFTLKVLQDKDPQFMYMKLIDQLYERSLQFPPPHPPTLAILKGSRRMAKDSLVSLPNVINVGYKAMGLLKHMRY